MSRPDGPQRPPLSFAVGRRVIQLPLVASLLVVWVLLYGELSPAVVASGLAVAVAIVWVFPLPAVDTGLRLRPYGLLVFAAHFAVDLVAASARVVRTAFAFGRTPRSSVIAVPLRTESDVLLTGTAITVSVIPGSVIVEVRYATSTLFVHALDVQDRDAADAARRDVLRVEERVTKAFGTRADIRRLEEKAALEHALDDGEVL
ncbi:multisubunit sodium/proton antiporter MrpE subunit [Murinocardiopsis flavida]|uniref:Multisubunit sodium/proton antiporter MrpE subunit n=1 Tax=Murinocardiopsis flavida TaxID=645275 RepID=A0A2P8DMT7_9ACTN|nr:Na+/H+ antiporter subunit E [Murinocardiopsis flavida]PSK98515.1 multisubunit sodium/proton antiporter MrpE subunit [Murinocardiopsis flavida]